mgnify:CR=1 FL=1
MRLIDLTKHENQARLEFFGCPLRCAYCTHIRRERKDYTFEQVLEFLADPKVDEVYLGGAEPGVQKKEILELLRRLKRMNKKVTLKTSGMYPELVRETVGLVNRYVIEVKCPLDDLACTSELTGLSRERTQKYLDALRSTLDILKGQKVRVWVRVIPGFATLEGMEAIGRQVSEVATEVTLHQFLSNPENDAPFKGISKPGPSEAEMVAMARLIVKHVTRVVVQGKGFMSEFVGKGES